MQNGSLHNANWCNGQYISSWINHHADVNSANHLFVHLKVLLRRFCAPFPIVGGIGGGGAGVLPCRFERPSGGSPARFLVACGLAVWRLGPSALSNSFFTFSSLTERTTTWRWWRSAFQFVAWLEEFFFLYQCCFSRAFVQPCVCPADTLTRGWFPSFWFPSFLFISFF